MKTRNNVARYMNTVNKNSVHTDRKKELNRERISTQELKKEFRLAHKGPSDVG